MADYIPQTTIPHTLPTYIVCPHCKHEVSNDNTCPQHGSVPGIRSVIRNNPPE